MKIDIQRLNQAVHFEGLSSEGLTVSVDGSESIGGEAKGMRPMELVLVSLGSCSGIDVVSILEKMREPLEDLQIEVEGQRANQIPAVFTDIRVKYILTGKLDPEKVGKAIALSQEKYCSVSEMLRPKVSISYEFEIKEAAE